MIAESDGAVVSRDTHCRGAALVQSESDAIDTPNGIKGLRVIESGGKWSWRNMTCVVQLEKELKKQYNNGKKVFAVAPMMDWTDQA